MPKRKYGPHEIVEYRRKREGRTDYQKRLKLLRSRKPRLVVRLSLKHVRVQVIQAGINGDNTLASAFSKELSDYGWKGNTSNTPSAYLVGLLCGFRARKAGVSECILDIDRYVPVPQTKIFSALKGTLDAGLITPHEEKVIPSKECVRGEHIKEYAEELKTDNVLYRRQFSNYLDKDMAPEEIPEHFNQVKQAIVTKYGDE